MFAFVWHVWGSISICAKDKTSVYQQVIETANDKNWIQLDQNTIFERQRDYCPKNGSNKILFVQVESQNLLSEPIQAGGVGIHL